MNIIAVPGSVSERDATLIKSIVAGVVPQLQEHFGEQNKALLKRIEELEARTPTPGEKGDRGDQGERGADGADGRDGIGMASALINRDGELVVTTTDGQVRELGIVVGRDGKDGVDGKDGAPGRDGEAGERGERGEAGENGRDGADAYPGEPKGLYDPAGEYRARDVVALNGGSFMAKRDNPGECPGDGWMLLVQRGKRGEQGDRGEKGEEGKPGRDGAQPVGLKFDAERMQFVMALDNGEVIEADFAPIVEAVIREVRGD